MTTNIFDDKWLGIEEAVEIKKIRTRPWIKVEKVQ